MDRSEHLAGILADWRARRDRGDSIAPEEVVRQHPELTEELRARFATIEAIDERFGTYAAIPREIGEFRILREVGRGGMGIVYEAEQPSMRRRVALKVLIPSIVASPKAVERFRREARAAGSLKHTNIVAVYQLGQEGGVWFSAMEFVEGRPLSEVIDDLRKTRKETGKPNTSRTLTGSRSGSHAYYVRLAQMFASVAEGLEVAHDHGVIHRDIKPSNLLLDPEGELRIVDFGLARLEDAASMTVTGDVVGTPSYMSPEQIVGLRDLDARTDVYSLGATLYEALTLRPPFVGPNLPALIGRITKEDPTAPRSLDRGLPRDLETIVLKALEKDPAARFSSAGELAAELRRFAQGESIRARRIGPAGRAWRLVKRHRIRSGLVAAILVAAVLGGMAWRSARIESAERRRLAYDTLCRAADLSATREWGSHEARLADVQVESRAFRLYSQAIEHDPSRWRAWLGRAMVRTTDVARGLKDVTEARSRGLPERTAHLARASLFSQGYLGARHPVETARELGLGLDSPVATELDDYLEGQALYGLREWGAAERALSRGLKRKGNTGPFRFLALFRRALTRERLRDWGGALQDLGAAQQLVGDDSLDTRMRLASYWWRLDQNERAQKEFEAVLADAQATAIGERPWWGIVIATLQSDELDWVDRASKAALDAHPKSLLLRNSRFEVLFKRLGDIPAALAVVSAVPAGTPADSVMHNNRGLALSRLGRHAEALAEHDAALAKRPNEARILTNRAVSLSALEQDDQALLAVDAALSAKKDFPPALAHKATILLRKGRVDEALTLAERAVRLADAEWLSWASHVHSQVLLKQGDLEDAIEASGRALASEPRSADAHATRGEILKAMGQFEEALRSFERAIELDERNKHAHQARAILLVTELKRPSEGLAAWEALVALPQVKGTAEAHLWIANLRRMQGDLAGAVSEFDRVLAAPPMTGIDLGLVASAKAHALARLEKPEEALAAAEDAHRRSPGHPGVLTNVAAVYLHLQQFAKARPLLEKALRINPRFLVARFNLGLVLRNLGEGDAALETFDAFIRELPKHPDGYYERGRLLEEVLSRPKDALRDAKQVVALEGGGFRGNVLLGNIYLTLDEPRKALEAYEVAIALDATYTPARANRALILASEGDEAEVKEAFVEFEVLLKEDPDPVTRSMYARCLALSGHVSLRDPKRAIELAKRALSEMPDDPDSVNTLGAALAANEDWKSALDQFSKAARMRDGGNGCDWIYLALAHAKLGDLATARGFFERASRWIEENAPKTPELQRAQAQVSELLR